MKYCTRCLYPDTKPHIWFNPDGLCAACIAYDERKNIDWVQREKEFKDICEAYKGYHPYYDCIVPVSGGKDSHWQVIKAKEYGLRVLAVTATTDDLSDIGTRNLDNISYLGVDHIIVTVDQVTRRKINKYTLETVGDISWAEHILIFSVPLREAMMRGIKLILWGENSQNAYGGPKHEQTKSELGDRWLSEFGGLNGLRVSDVEDKFNLSHFYEYPEVKNIAQVFMGHYFPWDGFENAEVAIKHGFEVHLPNVETSGFDHENLDNYQTLVHDYFKYIKFGFGRATDIASLFVRQGRMTREEAIEHIKNWEQHKYCWYLGRYYGEILSKIGMNAVDYDKIVEKFTNKDLFRIVKDQYGNMGLIPKFGVGFND